MVDKRLDSCEFGSQLLDSLSISEKTLNILFAALFLSSLTVFFLGNLLLLDVLILQRSMHIAFPCFGILLIFYTLSKSLGSVIWGLVLTYGLLWIVTNSHHRYLIPIFYFFICIGFIYTFRYLRVDRTQWLPLMLMGIIASLTVLGTVDSYTSFDMLERLHAGNVHKDTLYHASIAAMIKNYGVVSTGVHGLSETPYHIYSHVLFACISLLSGNSVLDVYGVANWILFAPILIFCVVIFCVILEKKRGGINIALLWGVVCLILLIFPRFFGRWGLWSSFFTSESYLISLGLFLLALLLLFKKDLIFSDIFLLLVLTVMISDCKVSVGLIFSGLWFCRIIFVKKEKIFFEIFGLIISVIIVILVVFHIAESNSETITFVPLHFIFTYSFIGSSILETGKALFGNQEFKFSSFLFAIFSILMFFIFHFINSWICLRQISLKKDILSLLNEPMAVYSLASFFAGLLIILLFSIPGGSAYYFSNVSFFVSLPFVVNFFYKLIDYRKMKIIPMLTLVVLFIILFGAKGIYQASMFSRTYAQQHSAFIDSLIVLRHKTPLNVVIRFNATESIKNPYANFVFAAVSERPWIDILDRSDRNYQDYGYRQFGLTKLHPHVTLQPKLLPGMKIISWPIESKNVKLK